MIKFITNTSTIINWDTVISEIVDKPGRKITADKSCWNFDKPGYKEVYDLWTAHNLNTDSMQWINYYPGNDFNYSVVEKFSDIVNAQVARAWVSRVNPGCYVGLHWDVDDNEQEYLQLGDLVRFTCHINKPATGQVVIVEDQYLYDQEQGNVYQWGSYKDWHSSFNCSLHPKFQFNFLGYR